MVRISQGQLNKIQLLDRPSFEKLRDERLRPQFNLDGLRILRLQAGRERDLRELYRHRAPYELLQNADDVNATKALFVLSPEGLAFAHNGNWFTVENFWNLAEGWSDKEPSECIGHKGLGFRSVLDVTPAPYLIKVNAKDFFAVKFAWALNNGHIQETLRRDSELRQIYSDWTKRGQSCCPVMAIPGLAKKQSLGAAWDILNALIRGVYRDHFTTMFWFPARDPEISSAVLSELSPLPIVADEDGRERLLKFLEDEVSILLPFLASVADVKIYDRLSCIASVRMPPQTSEQKVGEITVLMKSNREIRSQSYFRMSYVQDIPPTIRNLPDTPKAIKAMGQAHLSLLARLENGRPVYDGDSCFHVYFPTEEPTGMGLVVHGDFYVKPDRTRLMKSGYNEWLLKCAAKAAANEFLTTLLGRYQANSVFEVLSPSETSVSELGSSFRQFFAKALQERREPFIPTNEGLLKRDEVLLPPTIDVEGFWETHFASSLGEVMKAKKAFLAPAEDGRRVRAFLSLAQVEVLEPKSILDFIEVASKRAKGANWWYECYSYLVNEEKLSRCDHSFFAGHRLIPTSESTVVPVTKDDSDVLVSLPPTGSASSFIVPKCFSAIFVFMDNALAQLLQSGKDTVRSCVLDRFRISRFEATELLPRAIRRVAPQIFTGELTVTRSELITAWIFIKRITDASRIIQSSAFWEDIGRFPLLLEQSDQVEMLENKKLSPAFLSYWPDSWIADENCLSQVEGLRRIEEVFLNDLVSESSFSHNEWQAFFSQAGVSASPKVLRYSRVIGGNEELLCEDGKLDEFVTKGFRGEWQTDMNSTVVEVLRTEHLWSSTVASVAPCSHNVSKVIQNLTLLEGFRQVTRKTLEEFQSGDDTWKRRLWALIKQLPLSLLAEGGTDAVFCRGGGGHSLDAGSYLGRQLNHYAWLPSSLGPATSSDCFLRLSTKRLISSGTSGDELGDKILPYVAVDNIDEQARLQNLGVQVLDDAESASIPALIRALTIIGDRLSTEWGREEILKSTGRWRLVRGAIQEIYRRLNQYQGVLDCPPHTKFATRSPEGVQFRTTAMYYADPGSAVERAFMGMLPLFDADRPYPQLFEQISVIRLQTTGEGKTVEENLLAEDESKLAPHLCDEIVNRLAPFLLAPIVAKSERQKDIELIVRRLRERFEVKTSAHLTVSFSLVEVPSVQGNVDFPKFYLQRRVIPGRGAVEEAKYVLYIAGEKKNSIIDLDGDALGQALAPTFFVDRVSDDLAGIFPRIAYRYQQTNGKPDELQEFMLYQLGISREAQDMAREVILGETGKGSEAPAAPPPPIKVITKPSEIALPQGTIDQTIGKHQQFLGQKLAELVQGFVPGSPGRGEVPSSGVARIGRLSPGQVLSITAEQQNRGKRGEEEIKRRLQLPGGYDGFIIVADERDQNCGYDFLCAIGERQVELEVKTFTLDGRVIVTSSELQAAAASQDDYYLMGVLDDGKLESGWPTFLVQNPIFTLMTKGEFDIEAKLQAQASDVFRIDENR